MFDNFSKTHADTEKSEKVSLVIQTQSFYT